MPCSPIPAQAPRRHRAALGSLALGLWMAVALGGTGSYGAPPLVRQDEVLIEDQIAVEVIDRDIYGFDGQGGGRNRLRLDLGERVVAEASRGLVAYVMTDRRVLGLASGLGPWRELPLRVGESVDALSWISPRVLVIATAQRILGFDARSATWLQVGVGPHERVTHVELGASTAIVVTDRRAYGFSPDAGGFFAEPLRLHEKLERVDAQATLGQVRTSQRILIFRSPSGAWTVEKRPIN